jgi:hypothetical protein
MYTQKDNARIGKGTGLEGKNVWKKTEIEGSK